ncbi:MAG TPA: 50S ribosomal protein L35 [Candidatus Kaiserbacteria bacterium]|nr:50S ribosomal protein L35 [Candidatus Kaiserbacteria bacterium]
MKNMKTNKSYTKRVRVTKNGKLVARKPGQNHFNAKESGNTRRNKRRAVSLTISQRIRRRFFPGA